MKEGVVTLPQVKQEIKLEWIVTMPSGKTLTFYRKDDADDFKAMLTSVRNAALEQAANACEPHGDDDSLDAQCKRECAAAIRALMEGA